MGTRLDKVVGNHLDNDSTIAQDGLRNLLMRKRHEIWCSETYR